MHKLHSVFGVFMKMMGRHSPYGQGYRPIDASTSSGGSEVIGKPHVLDVMIGTCIIHYKRAIRILSVAQQGCCGLSAVLKSVPRAPNGTLLPGDPVCRLDRIHNFRLPGVPGVGVRGSARVSGGEGGRGGGC